MKSDLLELRKQAEQAVHDMPDGQLKVTAFETILKHLLSGNQTTQQAPATPSGGAKKQTKSGGAAAGAQPPTSFADRVLSLQADGFFIQQRTIAEIRQELKKNGWHYPVTSMSGPLQSLVQKKSLRRERADDGKGRKGWKYSNP